MRASRFQPVRSGLKTATVLSLLLALTRATQADVLVGTQGERLVGQVVQENADSVVFDSELAGRLTIRRDRIRELQRTPATPAAPVLAATNQVPAVAITTASAPTGAGTDGFDWIELKSGEWLKGRIKAMQDKELEFDSEELDLLTLDWKDIHQVVSPRVTELWFANGERLSGPVRINRETVTVGDAPGRTLPRDQLSSITPGGSKELNYWSGKVSAGLTLRAGNTEQVEYSATASLQRRTPSTRLSVDYLGNIASLEGTESANNHRVTTQFDYWLSRRLFVRTPYLEYYQDRFQNLDHRLTAGVGVGYDLIEHPRLEWNVTAGPAYQHNWYHSVPEDDPRDSGSAALVFGSQFDWEISRRIDLILEYRGQYTRKELGDTTHHGVATLSVDLTKRLDLDVSFVWDRISQPEASAGGTEPKPDDFRLVVGLGLDF